MSAVVHVSDTNIASFFREAFSRIECPEDISEPTIHALIEASLRGVDSHGIRLMPHYIDEALAGRINLSPRFQFNQTSPTTALLDADNTYGTAAAAAAIGKSMEMARDSGMGCTAVRNSSHFGAAAVYALTAARGGMIGMSFTNVDALVVPFGGKSRALGTNPICFAAPCEGEEPFCLDMATSAISWNKLMGYRIAGRALEDGWAVDGDGHPTADPLAAAALTPSGGYKGYGLALMVEILCSLLTGMPFGRHITPMFPADGAKRSIGHVLMAIDVSRFQDVQSFKTRMKELLTELRGQPPAPGFDRVLVANDPEKEHYRVRSKTGIPVRTAELEEFRRIAEQLKMAERL